MQRMQFDCRKGIRWSPMSEKEEPTQKTEKGLEIPVPQREDWDDMLRKVVRPAHDEPQEIVDAAEQELKYPEDETNEG